MRNDKNSFFQDVYEVVKQIPRGRISTYGDIAEYLGTRKSARMVGWAMNSSPPDVPAQRVVNRLGLLTGKHHFPPGKSMQDLLEKEGIEIIDDKIVNFKEVLWHPKELDNTI